MFDDPAEPATPVVPEVKPEAKPVAPTKAGSRGHGRRKLPASLPRRRADHDLPEAEKLCPCCRTERVRIGEEVPEQLDYRPSSLFVVEHHRFKYVCRSCETPNHQTAALPPQPIDKSLAGPGLLAHLVTSKYADHLPLNRLEGIVSHHGIDLQADACRGYDAIYDAGAIQEVACWAHARRKFHDARASDPPHAHAALGLIGELYAIEDVLKERTESERLASRQTQALPALTRLADATKKRSLPKSPIGLATEYARSNFDALTRYASAGFLSIDNNLSERTLRLVAIGRKNWMFAGSDQGGRTAAIFFSLTATCKHLGIDPFAYLRDLLAEFPSISNPNAEQLDHWLPDAWKQRNAKIENRSSND